MDRRGFGADSDGGYNQATRAYKADPTLETYLKLRRADPAAEIEVRVIGSFESMFYMREEFERHGLNPELVSGLLDADPESISEACLSTMEAMIIAQQRERTGETQLASRGEVIPLKLVDWIICCALDALSWNDTLEVPRDLIVLIRERLGGSIPFYEQVGHVREMKSSAGQIAGQLKAQGINPTFRLIGNVLGVAASTVNRWFEPGEFERETEVWCRLFDENGRLRDIEPGSLRPDDVAPDS